MKAAVCLLLVFALPGCLPGLRPLIAIPQPAQGPLLPSDAKCTADNLGKVKLEYGLQLICFQRPATATMQGNSPAVRWGNTSYGYWQSADIFAGASECLAEPHPGTQPAIPVHCPNAKP